MISWLQPQRLPWIVAHRGDSAHAPENTLAAFRRAIEEGADAIELDVRFSQDEEVVVFHDSTLDRMSGGSGLVRKMTLGQLKGLVVGAQSVCGQIPTLEEVFALCGGKVGINVEIKSDRQGRRDMKIVDRCCSLIKCHRLKHSVLVSSFHHRCIEHLKRSHPEIPGGLLFHPLKHVGRSAVLLAGRLRTEYVIFGGASLRSRVVRSAHSTGMFVGEFTVNTERRLERALRYGVDAIITDDPARIRYLLRAMK